MSTPNDLLNFTFPRNPGKETFDRLAALIMEQARGGPITACTPERTEALIAIGLALAYGQGGEHGIERMEDHIKGCMV